MIRVTIELVPWGMEEEKETLAVINIVNDGTGTPKNGNYNANLSVCRKLKQSWKWVRVTNFKRLQKNIYDLLYLVLKEAVGERNGVPKKTKKTVPKA